MSRSPEGYGGEGPRRPARPLALVTRVVLIAVVLAPACRGGGPANGGMPGTAPEGRGGGEAAGSRIVVIGVDGADWRVIDQLISQGRLPTFERLKEEGATGILESMEPSASPSLWTTVATGVRPERHGISGFVVPATHAVGAEPGGPSVRPVTSPLRRAPAFWNLVSSQDRRVGVIGWLVTWPAEVVNGYVVSSYLPYVYNWSTGRPLKGTFVEGLPRQTFPEELMDELGPLKVRPGELEPEILDRFYEASRVPALSADNRACIEGFRWSLAADQTYRRIGRRLFERDPVDLFAIYFGGIDVASHRFWKFSHPRDLSYGVGADEREILGNVIDEYYIYVDRIIEEYLEAMDEDDTLMVLSDHGFRPVLIPDRPTTSGHHRPEGILAILGRGAARARTIRDAGLLDILPTLLYLMELPIPSDLEGRILLDALDEEFTRNRQPRFVGSYGDGRAPAGPIDSELDRNILERLRSLGYIQ